MVCYKFANDDVCKVLKKNQGNKKWILHAKKLRETDDWNNYRIFLLLEIFELRFQDFTVTETIKCLQIDDEKLNGNAMVVLILICLFLSSFMTVHTKNESQTPFLTRALIA